MGEILGLDGKKLTPDSEEPDALEKSMARFRQAIEDPMARGSISMIVAKHITSLAGYPTEAFEELLKIDTEFEAEFQRQLAETGSLAPGEKEEVKARRARAQICLRVFLKIKPVLNEALKAEGLEGPKMGVMP